MLFINHSLKFPSIALKKVLKKENRNWKKNPGVQSSKIFPFSSLDLSTDPGLLVHAQNEHLHLSGPCLIEV
jgi:hypothetical protein